MVSLYESLSSIRLVNNYKFMLEHSEAANSVINRIIQGHKLILDGKYMV